MPENVKKTGPLIGAIDEGTSSARFLVKQTRRVVIQLVAV